MTHSFNTVPSRADVPSADLGDWYNARRPETLRSSEGPSRSEHHWLRAAAAILAALVGAEIAGWLRLVQIADQRLSIVAAAVAMMLIPSLALLAGSRLISDALSGFSLKQTRVVDVVAGALVTGVIVVIAGDFFVAYLVAMVLIPGAFVAMLAGLGRPATDRIPTERPGGDDR